MPRPPSREPSSESFGDLAELAHELEAPLTFLRSKLESALAGPLDEALCQETLARCLEEVKHLDRLVLDLLLLGRADAGGLMAQRSPAHLEAIALRVVERFDSVAREKNVRLIARLSEPLPVLVDEHQIERVIGNLVDNGIKYTQPGGRVLLESTSGQNEVTLSVADTGMGIDATQLELVFRRFYRVRREGEPPEGMGVGLSIARALAERNGGALTVTSAPGRGSRFTLSLARRTPEG